MKTMLILSFSDLKRDPRVFKQIEYFSKKLKVTTAGYNSSGLGDVQHIQIESLKFDLLSKLRYLFYIFTFQYRKALFCMPNIRQALSALSGSRFHYIVANDSYAWPVAFEIKHGAKIICDAHEYAPKEFEDKLKWQLLFQKLNYFICKTYLPQADHVLTVGEKIAEEYVKEFGITKPIVIMNTPPYHELEPSPVIEGRLRMIHHGNAIRSRKIENMIEMMNHVDSRFELNLMLIESDAEYLDELRNTASASGHKITFLTPVPMREIVHYISQFDIGVYILEPISFNNRFALPNKIFEFIQARLAVAIGPSPEMAHLVHNFDLGWVAETFSPKDLALLLNLASAAKVMELKQSTSKAAKILSFEQETLNFKALNI